MAAQPNTQERKGLPDALKPKQTLREKLMEERTKYETASLKEMTDEQKEGFAKEVLQSTAKKGKYADMMTLEEMYIKDFQYFVWYVKGIVMKESPAAARLLNGMLGLGIKF